MSEPALQALAAAVAATCGVPHPLEPGGDVDWDEFLRLVGRHRAAVLVHRSPWFDRSAAPPEPRAEIARRAQLATRVSLRVLAVQRRVIATLARAGVEAVVLKGPPLAVDAHGDPALRHPGDLDVLVAPEGVERALDALRAAGFEWFGWQRFVDAPPVPLGPEASGRLSAMPMLRHVTLVSERLDVEVHWTLFANRWLMPVDESWLRNPRLMEIRGLSVPALPLTAHWTYVLVHGTSHLWARMKWLADVPAMAIRHRQLARLDALEGVDAGYRRSVATGLLVAETVFGRFLEPESRAWAADVPGTATLVRRSLAAVRAPSVPQVVSPRALPGVVRARLAMRPDRRYRLDEVRLLLLSASRAQGLERPALLAYALGPLRWIRRTARRRAQASTTSS